MRKHIMRGAGLLLVLGSLLGFVPSSKADAQQVCACNVLCIRGDHCCTVAINGQCHVFCIPNSQPCP
jgi:hypothetical protein